MIHHLSIAARDPQHVAKVLAEFMGGAATRFTPNPGSWFAHQQDEHGTGVEVYPAGTQLRPAGPEGAGFAMTEPIRPGYSATHFALSVPMSQCPSEDFLSPLNHLDSMEPILIRGRGFHCGRIRTGRGMTAIT